MSYRTTAQRRFEAVASELFDHQIPPGDPQRVGSSTDAVNLQTDESGIRHVIVKVGTWMLQYKAVKLRPEALPTRQRGDRPDRLVEVDQALIQQTVDPRRGSIGGITRIKIGGCAGQTEADDIISRLRAGRQ